MKRSHLVLFILVDLLIVAALVWFFLFRGTTLDRPVSLVPSTADLYLEVASFAVADSALREISAAAGLPLSLPLVLGRDRGAMGRALADPDASGIDSVRPIGLAMSLRFGLDPLGIAFLPVKDARKLATALGLEAGALRSGKAVAFDGGWVATLDGYALVADDAVTIDDLVALDARGLDNVTPAPGAVMTLWITPRLIETARTLVEGFPAFDNSKAALFTREMAGVIVGAIERASIGLHWDADGLRLQTRWRLGEENVLAAALRAGSDATDLLTLLPPGALLSAFRIDPTAGRAVAAAALARTESLIEDSAARAMMEKSLDLVSREVATCLLTWGDGEAGSVRSLALQSVARGREAEFVAFQRHFQRQGAAVWESMMRGQTEMKARISFRDLPTERMDGLEILASEMRTQLEIPPIPTADAATREAFRRLSDQRVIQRFAVVEREGAESLFITAAGGDAATMRNQLALVRDGGPNASAAPSVQRVLAMIGAAPAAFLIADPLHGDALSAAFGVSARADGRDLVIEAVLPRDHLAALPMLSLPFSPANPPMHRH
jgi:hypothetical protein